MNNDEIQSNRLWNFRQIINAAGGTNEAARTMGKKNSQITQYAGPNPTRPIGNRMAGMIETAFDLPPGSIDLPPPPQSKNTDQFLAKLCSVLANAHDSDKEFLLAMAEWLVNKRMKLPTHETGVIINAEDIDA